MSDVIQSTTLRNNLSDVLDAVEEKDKEYLLVARKGKVSAALVNADLFEDLLALANPKFIKSIKEAREQIAKGEYFTHEQVFGELE